MQLFAPLVWLMQLVSKYTGEGPVISQIFAKLLHKILPVTCKIKIYQPQNVSWQMKWWVDNTELVYFYRSSKAGFVRNLPKYASNWDGA